MCLDPAPAQQYHGQPTTRQADLAYRELARTIELQPENYRARIDMANLLTVSRNFKQAQEQTDLLLLERPNDPAVHFTVSSLLAAQGNIPGAIAEMQKTIALAPDRWESYLSLALLQLRNNPPDAVEASLKKVIELNPKATQAQSLLGNYYQSRGRFSEAEQQLQGAIHLDPTSPEPRAALARLYLAEDRKTEAEQSLKEAKRVLAGNPAGYRMLGDFYFTTGDLDKATTEYAALYQAHPEDLQAKKNYIQLLIQKNRFTEARKFDDEILKVNPNDAEALVYKGRMQISDRDMNGATQTLQTVITNDPRNSEAHYALGVAFEKLGQMERAQSEWKETVRLRPNSVDAQRALAGAAMRQGDMSALEETATQIIGLQPGLPDGYALRGLSNLNRKHYAEAERDIRKAIEVAPQSAVGYVQMGNLRYAQKQYSAAEEAYQGALNRGANSRDALRGLINTYLVEKQLDKAIAAANMQIAKSPTNSGFYDLLGTVLFRNKKDLTGAEAAFQKSAELDKNNSDALIKLGQVQAAKGSVDQAIVTYQRSLKDNPREANFYLLLGDLYVYKKDWNQARDAYQNVLAIKPQDALASNNLALVILGSGGDLNVALGLAETARRGMPESSIVADTLGWIYYQRSAYHSAIQMFQEALRLREKDKTADDPTIHYHLGLAYEKTNQPGPARKQLERVLKIDPNYSDAANVKKKLAEL